MSYFWLAAKDQKFNNWLLFHETATGLQLRPRYQQLACIRCGKLDERQAIHLGLDADLQIRAKSDFLLTNDGFVCVSSRLARLLQAEELAGLEYIPISDGKYFCCLPTQLLPVRSATIETKQGEALDEAAFLSSDHTIALKLPMRSILIEVDACGMEFHDRCPDCGRFQESLYWPTLQSLTLPDSEKLLAAPDVPFEHKKSRDWWFLASQFVIEMLKANKVTGMEYQLVS